MIEITVRTLQGERIAAETGESEALCYVYREYEPGDEILITSDTERFLWVSMDAALPDALVYLPKGTMSYPVPLDKEHSCYCPGAFSGMRHIIGARKVENSALTARRNLACNPADRRGDSDCYPHATANVETRGEADFAARNAIDGLRYNHKHGGWPFQSWGIGTRTDAWLKVDLGREALIDSVAVVLRADFPHDSYWQSGHVVLSDGTDLALDFQKTAERQVFPIGEHRVSWARLERLVKAEDDSPFPALTEFELYGIEAE